MAKEYIEREAAAALLEEKLQDICPLGRCSRNAVYGTDRDLYDAIELDIDALNNIPAADVVEVVHGHWVGLEYDGYADGNPVYDLWECSECGNEVRGEDVPDTHPYCNGCGARMDGEK